MFHNHLFLLVHLQFLYVLWYSVFLNETWCRNSIIFEALILHTVKERLIWSIPFWNIFFILEFPDIICNFGDRFSLWNCLKILPVMVLWTALLWEGKPIWVVHYYIHTVPKKWAEAVVENGLALAQYFLINLNIDFRFTPILMVYSACTSQFRSPERNMPRAFIVFVKTNFWLFFSKFYLWFTWNSHNPIPQMRNGVRLGWQKKFHICRS